MVETQPATKAKEAKVVVPKIYAAIAAIQAGVGSIEKAGTGPQSQGSYKYMKNDDIILKVKELMVEHGVILRSEMLSHHMVTKDIGSNRSVAMVLIDMRLTYIAVADGSEFVVLMSAEGADNSDKGTRKAVTQAQKMANLLTFSIATGEPDPDGMETTPAGPAKAEAPPKATPVQARIDKANSTGATAVYQEIKAWLAQSDAQDGPVANAIGTRISGLPSNEWMKDEAVLTEVLKALKNGEVE